MVLLVTYSSLRSISKGCLPHPKPDNVPCHGKGSIYHGSVPKEYDEGSYGNYKNSGSYQRDKIWTKVTRYEMATTANDCKTHERIRCWENQKQKIMISHNDIPLIVTP
jgi:hypothetical protein